MCIEIKTECGGVKQDGNKDEKRRQKRRRRSLCERLLVRFVYASGWSSSLFVPGEDFKDKEGLN